jgi:hypothetical protein
MKTQREIVKNTLESIFQCVFLSLQAISPQGQYFYFVYSLQNILTLDHGLHNTADFDHSLHEILKIT